jgi:hypothetical protein
MGLTALLDTNAIAERRLSMAERFVWKDLPRQGRGGHVRDPWIAEQLDKLRHQLDGMNFPNGKALAKSAGVLDSDWFKIVQRFPSTPTQALASLHYLINDGIFDPREYPDIIMPNGEIRFRAWSDEQYYKGLDEHRARGLPVASKIETEQRERKAEEVARQIEVQRQEALEKIRGLYRDFPRAIPLEYDSKEGYSIYHYTRLPQIPSDLLAESAPVEDLEEGD